MGRKAEGPTGGRGAVHSAREGRTLQLLGFKVFLLPV